MSAVDARLGEQLERYLLGQLHGEERERIEASVFEDERFFGAVRDAEDHLIERFLTRDLSPEDAADFEHHFAATRERRERIAFMRALPAALGSGSGHVSIAQAPSPGRPRGALPIWLGFAATAATLVLGIWWVDQRALHRGPTSVPESARPGTGASPSAAIEGGPDLPQAGASGPAFVLRGGLLRGAGSIPRLDLPPDVTQVRLQADLHAVISPVAFSAVLRTVEGARVWRGTGALGLDGRRVEVVVPGKVLRPGDYILTIAAPVRQREEEYMFRVLRPGAGLRVRPREK
jgi:hypothetical protein